MTTTLTVPPLSLQPGLLPYMAADGGAARGALCGDDHRCPRPFDNDYWECWHSHPFWISALLDINSNKGGGGEGDNGHNDDGVLLSRIILPSHVLMDGRFVRLPPPLALERAAFFKWLVVSCCLINVEGEEGGGGEGEDKENWGRMGSDNQQRWQRRPCARARSVNIDRSTTPHC